VNEPVGDGIHGGLEVAVRGDRRLRRLPQMGRAADPVSERFWTDRANASDPQL